MEVLGVMSWTRGSITTVWEPPTDVYETSCEYVVRVEIAGIACDDVSVSLVDRVLTISGTRRDPEPKVGYHRMEIPYGAFQTKALLPRRVDATRVQAEYRDGFLTITVPKLSPVRVPVENGGNTSGKSSS
ncbi:MAG: Hsp20/alpha crystallin family protein [Anaerolineae bacterium]